MLALKDLPKQYIDWNEEYHAPYGKKLTFDTVLKRLLPWEAYIKKKGFFSVQTNNTTRMFEYPWAFYNADLSEGQKVLEIGGGLSGFQFVLDALGCHVVNIDPGMEAKGKGWLCDNNKTQQNFWNKC